MNKTDTYDAFPHNSEILVYQQEVFQKVWSEANELRRSGKLLQLGKQIMCPVVAIHGDYDPHPVRSQISSFSYSKKFSLCHAKELWA